jgi:hypothetical protein
MFAFFQSSGIWPVGFRARRSCESQLLMTTNDITKWMNNNIQIDIAILDIAKAFDKVAH